MIDYISTAAINFFQHQMGAATHISDDTAQVRTDIAYIDVNSSANAKYRVYVAMETPLLQQISELFFGESVSDAPTLQGMLLETTNMIVGSAKVLAEDSSHGFTIETPFFEENAIFDTSCDEQKRFKIGAETMIIGIKEL